ncbi:hypothetical protein ACJW31_04G071000 [Castanea mollissima]
MVKLRLKRCGKKQHIICNFLEPYEEKTSYTFLGGVLFIHIYPNGLEGRALWKVGFYDSIKNQTYLNVLAILYFLERGAHPIGTIHGISKKAGVFMELCLNQQIIFN